MFSGAHECKCGYALNLITGTWDRWQLVFVCAWIMWIISQRWAEREVQRFCLLYKIVQDCYFDSVTHVLLAYAGQEIFLCSGATWRNCRKCCLPVLVHQSKFVHVRIWRTSWPVTLSTAAEPRWCSTLQNLVVESERCMWAHDCSCHKVVLRNRILGVARNFKERWTGQVRRRYWRTHPFSAFGMPS